MRPYHIKLFTKHTRRGLQSFRRPRIWCEWEHETRGQLQGAESAKSVWEANDPLNAFPIFRENLNGEYGHFINFFWFQNLIYHFPEQITNRTVHLRPNRFIFERIMLSCHVTAQCNAIFLFTWLQDLILRFTKTLASGDRSPCRCFAPGLH